MSYGVSLEDIAWQAFQAGAGGSGSDADHKRLDAAFVKWWALRIEQGAALPACPKCFHDPTAKVQSSWTFTIELDPPSANERITNGEHGWKYRKKRDTWCWAFRAARLAKKIWPCNTRRRTTLTRLYSGRQKERDVDNLTGGGKLVVDAMVLEGLIRGDSPADAEIHWMQERGNARGVRVLLEELL